MPELEKKLVDSVKTQKNNERDKDLAKGKEWQPSSQKTKQRLMS